VIKKMLSLVAFVVICGLPLAYAQKDAGKPYGARDPQTCASRKEPAKGAISAAQEVQYFTCDWEGINGFNQLDQVANVTIEVAQGRPYNHFVDSTRDIDPSQLVYNIRGSFDSAYCIKADGKMVPYGTNCQSLEQHNAVGTCWKNLFGDWHCKMADPNAQAHIHQGVPPLK
jgi:hypothetical protein